MKPSLLSLAVSKAAMMFSILSTAALAGPTPGSPGVSGFVPGDDAGDFVVTLIDAYYCAIVAERSVGGVGIERRVPQITPQQYQDLAMQVMSDPIYGLQPREIEAMPQLLGLTARIQYVEDLEASYNNAERLMLTTQLPACESYYVAKVRLQ